MPEHHFTAECLLVKKSKHNMKTDKQIECHDSNCLFFAVGRWWNKGGYLIIRKSHFGWWPHFLWSPDLLMFEAYSPLKGGIARWLPPVIFRGYIQHKPPHLPIGHID